MRSHLVIIHRSLSEGASAPSKPFVAVPGGAVWTTCLRSIAIGSQELFADQIHSKDQIKTGHAAYEFMLEAVCGLHSPVKGETEVHGQFKQFLESAKVSLPSAIYKCLHQVHVDAKRVRTACLRHLGGQSYGSFCRRHVRDLKAVSVVGAGHLAGEILPWLTKSAEAQVFCRNAVKKAAEIQKRFATVKVNELFASEAQLSGAVILAAPIKSQELMAWFEKTSHNVELVIDLRAESAEDPIPQLTGTTVINLKRVFEAIESAREKIDAEVESARRMIKEIIYATDLNKNFGPQKRPRTSASLSSRTSA